MPIPQQQHCFCLDGGCWLLARYEIQPQQKRGEGGERERVNRDSVVMGPLAQQPLKFLRTKLATKNPHHKSKGCESSQPRDIQPRPLAAIDTIPTTLHLTIETRMEHSPLTSSEPSPSPITPTASRRRSRRHNCVGIVALAVGKSSRVRACLGLGHRC